MAIVFGSNKLVESGNMNATIVSDPINLTTKEGLCVHAVYTGSPVGVLSLEASIDGLTYETIYNTTTAISAAGSQMFNVGPVFYPLLRLRYAFTSGTGTLNVLFSTKEDE